MRCILSVIKVTVATLSNYLCLFTTMNADSIAVYRKKSILLEEEEIVCKLSPDLTPDEYVLSPAAPLSISVFRTRFGDLFDEYFTGALKGAQIDFYGISTTAQLLQDLHKVAEESKTKGGLLLIFIGFIEMDGCLYMSDDPNYKNVQIKSIWDQLSIDKWPHLSEKPKMLFFTLYEKPKAVETDSKKVISCEYEKFYESPVESDFLIFFKRMSVYDDFWKTFCQNVAVYGEKYDIIDLLIMSQTTELSLTISTCTRKFYFSHNKDRNHHLSVNENHKHIVTVLEKLRIEILDHHASGRKKKDTLFGTLGKKMSFRQKNKEKPVVVLRQNHTNSKKDDPVLSINKGKIRTVSETDSKKSRTSLEKTKPPWKN